MGKFSVVQILDDRSDHLIALTVSLRTVAVVYRELFHDAHQISGTQRGKVVLDDFEAQFKSDRKPSIEASDTLILLGSPVDYSEDEFEELLIPYIEAGMFVLITVDTGYESLEEQFSSRVSRIPLNKSVLTPPMEWAKKMGKVLKEF